MSNLANEPSAPTSAVGNGAHPAVEHLRSHQRQLDADGCEVGVSRQALDETLALLARAQSAEALLVGALKEIAAEDFNGPPGLSIYAAASNELLRRRNIARTALAKGLGEQP